MNHERNMELENRLKYIHNMRPLFSKQSLFSDETKYYRTPEEPEPGDMVTIRFRTRKNNVDEVYFISGSFRQEMKVIEQKNGFDYYEIQIQMTDEPVHYYFEINTGKIVCYYNELGVTKDLQERFSFGIVPGFKTPGWAKGAVMYQIFPDRFCNGDLGNDVLSGEYSYINAHVHREENWNAYPQAMDVRSFYGGDLQGIIDKLDYLQDLGVEVLYLNPIFVSPSNHKYDIQDYDYVDPHYGRIVEEDGELLGAHDTQNAHATRYIKRVTNLKNLEASNELFIELVEELHRRGMKIILDGVFNHCGSFNKWLDRERIYEHQAGYEKGAYVSADSPYRSFFKFNNEHSWPYNEFYNGWWGHDTLPKLNYEESKKLEEYILRIAAKWVSPPFNVDGWRLDVAADLGHSQEYNHQFWKKFRKTVKRANPEAIVLAEHYGDAESWIQGDEWDTVMNYDAFMEPVSWFLTGMEKHSDEFRPDLLGNPEAFFNAMRYHMARFYGQSLQVAMNQLDNHDHSRFLTRTNHQVGRLANLGSQAAEEGVSKAILREGVIMQMTWPGAPTLYYGDEAGVCGFTDPDNRRTYPWGNEDEELIRFYKEAIALHKTYDALKYGSLKELYSDYNVIAYGRFTNDEQVVVIINNRNESAMVEVPVWQTGISRVQETYMKRMLYSNAVGFSMEDKFHQIVAGIMTVEIGSRAGMIFYRKEPGL